MLIFHISYKEEINFTWFPLVETVLKNELFNFKYLGYIYYLEKSLVPYTFLFFVFFFKLRK